jgi:hypothetical protein
LDILHLIDRLEEMVGEARRLPVGGGSVMSRQRLIDLIDRMRVAVREVCDAARCSKEGRTSPRGAEEARFLLAGR